MLQTKVYLLVPWILALTDVSTEVDPSSTKYDSFSGQESKNSSSTSLSKPPPSRPSLEVQSSTTKRVSTTQVTSRPSPTTRQTNGKSPSLKQAKPLPKFDDERSKLHFDPEWCFEQFGCGNMHVMCQYPMPGPSTNCVGYNQVPLTDTDIVMIIHYFNYRRNLVAGGKEYRLPSASDMRILEWDDTLATFAQRWADQCIYDPNILKDFNILGTIPDTCRDLPGFDVGQVSDRIHDFNSSRCKIENVMHVLINTISSNIFNVTSHILLSGYIPEDDFGAVALHSQAYLIGCGIASFLLDIKTDSHRMTVIHCNIGPLNGVHLLDRYYKLGEPCSSCPSRTSCQPNSYFQYLCQKDNVLDNPLEVNYSYNSGREVTSSYSFFRQLVTASIYHVVFIQFMSPVSLEV